MICEPVVNDLCPSGCGVRQDEHYHATGHCSWCGRDEYGNTVAALDQLCEHQGGIPIHQ